MVRHDHLHEKFEKASRRIRTVLTLGCIKARERAYIDSLKETVVVEVGKDGKAKTKTVWKSATGMVSNSTLDTSMNSSMLSLSWHNYKTRLSNSWHNSWQNSKSKYDNSSSFPKNSHHSMASLPSILKNRVDDEEEEDSHDEGSAAPSGTSTVHA
jgi:hypothetical protein